MNSGRLVETNLERVSALVRQAAGEGAQYVLTPENALLMETEPAAIRQAARQFDDNPALASLRALARELGIWLHVGSLAVLPKEGEDRDNAPLAREVDEDEPFDEAELVRRMEEMEKGVCERKAGKLHNRSCLISPQGAIVASYDKIHLFDVRLANGEKYRESDTFLAGKNAVLAEMPPDGKEGREEGESIWLGMSICYDLRFPMLYSLLARSGAQILTVPAAFTRQTGEAHWRPLLRARAIENGCFVLAAAQGGRHENGRSTWGHSMIVDPWGRIIAEAGESGEEVLLADLDMALVDKARSRIPSLKHYRLLGLSVREAENRQKDVS
jgi:predicted amidohydrolase